MSGTGGTPTDGVITSPLATVTDPVVTPAVVTPPASTGSIATDAVDPSKATSTGTIATDAVDPNKAVIEPAKDPAKNADGTDKTPEQIAKDAADEAAKKAVPEKYELVAPEGKQLDQAQIDAFTPVAKELGLSNVQAQKLVDLQIKLQQDQAQAGETMWATLQDNFKAACRSDKEFGEGAGGKSFAENISFAAKGLDTFGTPGLRQALIDSGMGNHPEMNRLLVRIGRAVSEDTIKPNGGAIATGRKDLATLMYPTMAPKS